MSTRQRVNSIVSHRWTAPADQRSCPEQRWRRREHFDEPFREHFGAHFDRCTRGRTQSPRREAACCKTRKDDREECAPTRGARSLSIDSIALTNTSTPRTPVRICSTLTAPPTSRPIRNVGVTARPRARAAARSCLTLSRFRLPRFLERIQKTARSPTPFVRAFSTRLASSRR